jgi:hypothetical protein
MNLEKLVSLGTLTYEECLPFLNEIKTHPWLMIAWGVEANRKWIHLTELRKKWMYLVHLSELPYFGKLSGKYYHPCLRLHVKRVEMIKALKRIYKKSFIHILVRKKDARSSCF